VIQLGESATVSGCTVGNAGFTGIQVGAGGLIEDCVAIYCGQGFELSGENFTIVRSVSRYNGGNGIDSNVSPPNATGAVRDLTAGGTVSITAPWANLRY
jgi:hypothetical protein